MDVFADTLHLHLRRSAYQRILIVALHAVAIFVAAGLAWYRPWLCPLLGLIGVSLGYSWRSANRRWPMSIVRLRWQADGRWWWQTYDNKQYIGDCVAADVHGASLVVLTLRAHNGRWRYRRCVLFIDALDATSHRRLRARLRVAPPDTPASPANV